MTGSNRPPNNLPERVPGLVTVITPTYNRAHLLEETLKSVFAQSYPHWEMIVADDGSTDDTAELMQDIVARSQHRERIRYLELEHTGLPAAGRNSAIALARGEYIAFLDSDDLWLPHKLEEQVRLLQDNPSAGMVCADIEHFAGGSEAQGSESPGLEGSWSLALGGSGGVQFHHRGDGFAPLYRSNFVNTSTAVVRSDVLDEVGVFDEAPRFRAVEDHHLWLRIAAGHDILYPAVSLARYRLHETRISTVPVVLPAMAQVLIDIRDRCPDKMKEGEVAAERLISDVYRNLGLWNLRQGLSGCARPCFREALRWRPGSPGLLSLAFLSAMPGLGRISAAMRRTMRPKMKMPEEDLR